MAELDDYKKLVQNVNGTASTNANPWAAGASQWAGQMQGGTPASAWQGTNAAAQNSMGGIGTVGGFGSSGVNDQAYIDQLFKANQEKQEAALRAAYDRDLANYEAEQIENQRQTDANLNRTYVESQKSQQGFDEMQNAYGLTSGAMAQSRLSRDTQLQDDLTTLRAVQQAADAEMERRRTLRGQQLQSDILEAAANNDIERVKALYEAAKEEEARMREDKEKLAQLFIEQTGDYSVLGQLYGLPADAIALLNAGKSKSSSGSKKKSTGSPNPPPVDIVSEALKEASENGTTAANRYIANSGGTAAEKAYARNEIKTLNR